MKKLPIVYLPFSREGDTMLKSNTWSAELDLTICSHDNQDKKNPVNKNQGWELIHQKYKAKENTSKHNSKKKQKQTINTNQINTFACKEDS